MRTSAPPPAPHLPPRYVTGRFTYEIESDGIVSAPHDSADHPDTVETRSTLAYDARWQGAQLLIAGQVQYRVVAAARLQPAPSPSTVRSDSRTSGVASGAAVPPPAPSAASANGPDSLPPGTKTERFELVVDTVTGAFRRPADSMAVPGCVVGGPAVEQDEALAADRPRSLAPGAQWTDTLTKSSCLAGIPVTTRTTRTFLVGSAPAPDPVTGAPSVMVSYQSNGTIDGEARRHADLVTLHAGGTGTTEQYYDRGTGVLLSAHTATTFDLDAAINGKPAQHLHQVAQWRAHVQRPRS